MPNGLFNHFKRKKENKELVGHTLKIKNKEDDLYFIIPNISCVSGIQKKPLIDDENLYTFEIYTQGNVVQVSLDSERKAKNRHKQIIQLIEQWWNENG